MILYVKDLQNFSKKLLDTINRFSKVAVYKNQFTKISSLCIYNNEQTKKEYRKIMPFTIVSKKQSTCSV
jgi:hypothetical protein